MRQISVNDFSRQLSAMSHRIYELLGQVNPSSTIPPGLASAAFKELGVASEELQVVMEELQLQNESMVTTLEDVAVERNYYRNLFEFAPEACLVTGLDGVIRDANRMAAQLLGVSANFLPGKPLLVFVQERDRPLFWSELQRRQQRNYFQEWQLRLESRQQVQMDVACLVIVLRNDRDEPIGFHWVFREISQREHFATLDTSHLEGADLNAALLLHERPLHSFKRGDIIPMQSQSLWYVSQGLVKLSTLADHGREVLTGLCGVSMILGNYLTALPLYEAKALSDVELVAIPLAEIASSPPLIQLFLSKTCQRLRQTEILLAISGEPRLEYRLFRLLYLLKEEVGQPIDTGVRLRVRLTHEDLASACCSTRVTITRLLGKLQHQGKIRLDDKHHIILAQDWNG